VGFTIKGLLDVTLFNVFMSNLLATKANDLYRTKGVLAFEDQDDKFVFQGVHEQINFGPSEKGWAEGEERASKLVFIGKNLDYDFLKKSISECATDPSTVQVKMHKRA
jgi:G3E family GTPase